MPTTTNYGWTTPADTDLVKDGAAAIRTLGSGVDTTVKNLNPETTLGDISYRSSTSNTNTRLAIGSAGQVLTVSSGVPSWATPAAAGGMTLLDTLTLSGSSTTSSTFSSSYKQLFIYYKKVYVNTAGELYVRLNADTGNNYNYRNIVADNGGVASYMAENATNWRIGYLETTSGDKTSSYGFITLMNPSQTDVIFGVCSNYRYQGGNLQNWNSALIYDSTAAITSVTLRTDNSFSGGTAYIYGVS